MQYRTMTETDLDRVVPLYVSYYNEKEGGTWTYQTAYKRIHQVWSHEDGFCLLMEKDGEILGFAMGHMEQFDDLVAYDLVEILIFAEHQGKGYGTMLMRELERQVKALGASLIQLKAVNDEKHNKFYGKLGCYDSKNLTLKGKFLEG